jgi:hypothetical protein
MRIRTLASAMAASGVLALPAAVHAAPPVPPHSSCAEFGGNVAGLAQTLGSAFGATASTVAGSGPRAFPTAVVHPEQTALCEPR